ncbi:MAG TPA: beta-ketoacyl synthase N-terminal-like domain-containing protein [Cellvibrio sp.]|nr:beta-ketoacyl synthase N-terminal-like domain-containing protein [Cellvibrio sp.]
MGKKPVNGNKTSSIRKRKSDASIAMAHVVGEPLKGILNPSGSLADILLKATTTEEQIIFVHSDASENAVYYRDLFNLAKTRLAGLRKKNIPVNSPVILVFNESIDFVVTFWACILGGYIPVPMAYPTSFTSENATLTKLMGVWEQLKHPSIITDSSFCEKLDDLRTLTQAPTLLAWQERSLDIHTENVDFSPTIGDEIALIQYSSGSTGAPKGVALSHKNLITNIEAMMISCGWTSGEKFISWMPYSHDMGLIGLHLFPMACVTTQINLTPQTFVRRPLLWLEKIAEHKAAHTGSPNFGYRLVLDRITDKHLAKLDLSCLRKLYNGAEPISVPLMREFVETLKTCGFRATTMYPVYGMAEASLAVSFPPADSEPIVHSILRSKIAAESHIKDVAENADDSMLVVDEGFPVNAIEIRIVDEGGELLPEGQVGHIQIAGDNVTRGYFNNDEANKECFDGKWLKTGDLGFIRNQRLSVTGRAKDVVIANGQKYFAYDIEFCAGQHQGLSPTKIAVCGWHDAETKREKIVLFAITKGIAGERESLRELFTQVWKGINDVFSLSLDCIVSVKNIPRTTSGKLQRYQLREAFIAGEFKTENCFFVDELLSVSSPSTKVAPHEPSVNLTQEDITDLVHACWASVLGYPRTSITQDDHFRSLGGTSIKAVQLLGLLEETFATRLSHEFLLQCRNIREMSVYLLKHLANENHAAIGETLISTGDAATDGDIAIISMACRFPDAESPEIFWENLLQGRDSIKDIPNDRWNADLLYEAGARVSPGKTNSRWGGFIDSAFDFDPAFFNLSDDEARLMDPQQRLFLQAAWEAMENAGYTGTRIDGANVGVFVGASHNNYMEHQIHRIDYERLKHFESLEQLSESQRAALLKEWKDRFGDFEIETNSAVNNILNMIAARVSHSLNLKGPSLTIDTACSSSLVAIHLASESIRRGECEMAIAGGINLNLTPTPYVLFSKAGALSPTGRCKVFDESADGFVPGEGLGIVVLKPLSRALQDGDLIHAVIKRSFVNNDGRSLGVMAPNPDGQRVAIASVYRDNTLDASSIQYLEAHGTGTLIGDPSELRSLSQVFAEKNVPAAHCVVGSVKANIGHLLSAAGVASLIKLIMALKHKKMPPSLHIKTPNPQLNLPNTAFRLLTEPKTWEAGANNLRRGAINSFGFGGTNCHMVIEEAGTTATPQERPQKPLNLLCVSARTPDELSKRAGNLANHLIKLSDNASLTDICFSQYTRSNPFPHRAAFVIEDSDDAIAQLKSFNNAFHVQIAPKYTLMFTGQGAQYINMAKQLYETLPQYKKIVDECSAAFYDYLEHPLVDYLYRFDDANLLAQTWLTQPVIFALDYSLGKLLLDWGLKPTAMLGHSVGEYAAACLAGVMSLADAARIVAARGRLMYALPEGGGMLAVFDSRESLATSLAPFENQLWFAAHNGKHQVIAGKLDALNILQEQLQLTGKVCKPLQVSHAFHTPLLDPMLDEFEKVLNAVHFKAPAIPLISNIGGKWIDQQIPDARYWKEHISAPVCFEQSINLAVDMGITAFIECGPDKILANLTKSFLERPEIRIFSCLDRKRGDWESLLGTMAGLFTHGIEWNWIAFDADFSPKRVSLPTYPFTNKSYRIETKDRSNFIPHRIVNNSSLTTTPAPTAPVTIAPVTNMPLRPALFTTAQEAMGIQQSARVSSQSIAHNATDYSHTVTPRNWNSVVSEMIARHLAIAIDQLDMFKNFNDLGMDSATAVKLSEELAELVQEQLSPTLLFEYQSPSALVDYLKVCYGHGVVSKPITDAPLQTSATQKINTQSSYSPVIHSQKELETGNQYRDQDIAIIGIGLRLPGANNIDEFWKILIEGKTQIREVNAEQWSLDDYFGKEQLNHTSYSKWGAFIDRAYDFDPLFFGISPREAEVMDPQQRLFLEVAFEALQQSGYGGEFRTRDIGIYVGCEQNHYGEHFILHQRYQALCNRFKEASWFNALNESDKVNLLETLRDVINPAELISDAVAGNGLNEIPARVSHWLDLRGPNMTINTACSSSLVAVHLACDSLRRGESKMAIAGGAYLTGNDSPFVFLSRVGALSPTGACSPFDEKANGMVLGEGISAVILKPLKEAVADGDCIMAVIKGSAVNNDGHSNGITAPNPRGQADALCKAYINAGISPEQISYVECHGTGTPLGDPVELEGMTQAYRKFTNKNQFCAVGSLKSSFGHMLSGSSVPSLIKVVLSLRNRTIPHTVNFEKANSHINFSATPFHVISGRPQSWQPQGDQPLRAGVNSFGFGGTNCHMILEEAPVIETLNNAQGKQLLLLSGRTQNVLQQIASRLSQTLQANSHYNPAQICLSMNGSQRDLAFKSALVIDNRDDLLEKLSALMTGQAKPGVEIRKTNPKLSPDVYLVLDGKNPFNALDIDELIERFPQFQQICNECKEYHQQVMQRSNLLNQSHLDDLIYAFAVQYALGRIIVNSQIQPAGIFAEGIGVIAGACLTGVLSLKQAVEVLLNLTLGKHDLHELITGDIHHNDSVPCPLILSGMTIQGAPEQVALQLIGYLQSPRSLTPQDVQPFIKTEAVILHLGSSPELATQLGVAENPKWLGLSSSVPAVSSLLTLFGSLYLRGVSFDSRPFIPEGVRKVVLPTYPFENKAYRFKPLAIQQFAEKNSAVVHTTDTSKPKTLIPVSPPLNVQQLIPMSGAAMSTEERNRASYLLKQELKDLID